MKANATVLIVTALAVIAAATVVIALQVSLMANRLERIEGSEQRSCTALNASRLTTLYTNPSLSATEEMNLYTAMEEQAEGYCKG